MLHDWFTRLRDNIRPYLEEKNIVEKEKTGLDHEIKEAHRQWIEAQNYFENVSEPELIDHASYKIQAARTKYMYLLNKAKESNTVFADQDELINTN